ncbi:GNAT family N-acetyltransferase [Litoribrevibacter albus]|uniref:N-acetyltransferase GCN5 n=1 Tax=Litoribrevibacter albus TaxID=1473156 RepID=A0AA37S8R2_9GAMM|nr:GNAT family N-acetyltransferase [Litoribrevibacter albus]GLQ30243.1 N-acetyltransferase GCN5 [Litoribrevibacter albus]
MAIEGLNLSKGLGIRPSTPSDKPFLEKLHNSTRDDLKMIDGEKDFVESFIQMQYQVQTEGYGDKFPNAMYFIVEKLQEPIGKVTIDFGQNEIRLVDIAFIPLARGKGYGEAVLSCLQQAAAQAGAPLTLSVFSGNVFAKNLYLKMGFVVEQVTPPYEFLVWYPKPARVIV